MGGRGEKVEDVVREGDCRLRQAEARLKSIAPRVG